MKRKVLLLTLSSTLLMSTFVYAGSVVPVTPQTDETSLVQDEVALDDASLVQDELPSDDASLVQDELALDDTSLTQDELDLDDTSLTQDELPSDDASLAQDELALDDASLAQDEAILDETSLAQDEVANYNEEIAGTNCYATVKSNCTPFYTSSSKTSVYFGLDKGTRVTLLDHPSPGTWKIQYGNNIGYMNSSDLSFN